MVNGDFMMPAFPQNDEIKATAQLVVDMTRSELAKRTQVSQSAWGTIQPFESVPLPCINPQILPPSYQVFADTVTEGLQVPLELVFVTMMAVTSTAVQGKFVVRVREGYTEPLNTYWIAPLPPSELKSPTMKLCKAPLEAFERDQNVREAPEIKRIKSEQATLTKTIEHKRTLASKTTDAINRRELMDEIQKLEEQQEEVPEYTRLLVDDATPEALGQLMAKHGGKISHIEAEATLLDNIAGRYSQGKPNMDIFLKGYSVESIRIDRRHSEPMHIAKPHLTFCVTPQPYALQNRGATEAFRGRGADARCLFILPRSKVGMRNMEPKNIIEEDCKGYYDHIYTLLSIPQKFTEHGELHAHELTLSHEAYAIWLDFANAVEASLGQGGELHSMQDWGGKIRGNVARVAGLLHCARHREPQNASISKETMGNACYLGTIFIEHAKAAYQLMGENENTNRAKKVLSWIQAKTCASFSVRDCHQALRNLFSSVENVETALNILETRNYIARAPMPEREGAGRPPSQAYNVNPAIFNRG